VQNAAELANTVVATREGVPILLSQVAIVRTGQSVRMGSASENVKGFGRLRTKASNAGTRGPRALVYG
jgi:Cu/Ag efflux pump CusA